MAPGFTIAEVRFRGTNAPDAVVPFAPGLTVISGPSNTGKSLLRSAINFVFGASDPMKQVEEAAPYRTILVEIRTADGAPITFERAWNGGDIKQYRAHARNVTPAIPVTILAAKHSADNQDNISAVLLTLAGLTGIRGRKNQNGELRNLSFRDLIEYSLISEERIITELSPIHTANYTDKTFESSLFRILLTGKDDKDIIVATAAKDEKARAAGQEIAIERFRADLTSRIPQDGREEDDLRRATDAIDARINEQSRLLQNYRADLTGLEVQRRDLDNEHRRTFARLTQVNANLQRFALLKQQYESDLQRLQSNVEAGSLFGDYQEGKCPICGAEPHHHVHHAITPAQLATFTSACRAEAEKIHTRQADLTGTMAQLETERADLHAALLGIERRQNETAQALRAIVEPSIANLDEGLTGLVEQRAELARVIGIYEELHRLDAIEMSLEPTRTPRTKKDKGFASLPPDAYVEFAKAVEGLLRAWSFPELERVVFDTTAEDIVVSGKARKDNGKGYRAITYAAFMIGLLHETNRKHLPHPGFIILDSPLVTYREPQEHMGEGVKAAFYRNLAATILPAQVIILENVEPPEDLKEGIGFEGFTKNRATGRYGLFPPLPVKEQ